MEISNSHKNIKHKLIINQYREVPDSASTCVVVNRVNSSCLSLSPELCPKYEMSLGLTESLSTLVKWKYDAAKAAENLIFSTTHLALVHLDGVSVRNSNVAKDPGRQS